MAPSRTSGEGETGPRGWGTRFQGRGIPVANPLLTIETARSSGKPDFRACCRRVGLSERAFGGNLVGLMVGMAVFARNR